MCSSEEALIKPCSDGVDLLICSRVLDSADLINISAMLPLAYHMYVACGEEMREGRNGFTPSLPHVTVIIC